MREPVAWMVEYPHGIKDATSERNTAERARGRSGATITPLYPHPLPATPGLEREAVARIIDPHNWSLWTDPTKHIPGDMIKGQERVRAPSLAKADAIIALRPPSEREAVREIVEAVKELIDSGARMIFRVSAYDESGYGDDRSKEFNGQEEALAYAASLDQSRFRPSTHTRLLFHESKGFADKYRALASALAAVTGEKA